MSNRAAEIANATIIALLNGAPIDPDQRGKFIGLNFGSNMTVASGPDGFLNVDGAPAVAPGGANTELQFNNAGAFGGATNFMFIPATGGLRFASFTEYGPGGSQFAAAGFQRFRNGAAETMLAFRNAANTADNVALHKEAGDKLWIGSAAGAAGFTTDVQIDVGSTLSFSHINSIKQQINTNGTRMVFRLLMDDAIQIQLGATSPATAGDVRGRNNRLILALRNAGDTGDINAVSTDASDNLVLGATPAGALGALNNTFLYAANAINLAIGANTRASLSDTLLQIGRPAIGLASATSPWGVHGKTTKAMADANQTLTAAEYANTVIETTGAITANRTLTFPTPTDAQTYWKILRNTCTGAFSIVATLAAGTTVTVANGSTAIVGFHAAGAVRFTADVVH